MRKVMILIAVVCFVAATASDAAGAPPQAPSPKPQATVVGRPSPVIGGAEAITIPQMLSYQGRLTDTLGQPVPNGNYALTFRLYATPSGGSAFWIEAQTIMVINGLFSAHLGALTPITSVPDPGELYLGLQVAASPELSPRLRIVSSAYSYLAERAANSDLLQGKDTTGFVRTGQANSVNSAMITDGTIAAADLGQMGAATGQVLKWTGSIWAPRNDSVGAGDNAWTRADSVLYTAGQLGIARGAAANVLHGTNRYTHTNLGVACTTGTSGQNYFNSTVGGGYRNVAAAGGATVGGGGNCIASGAYALIGGGSGNTATMPYTTVAGGYQNNASATYATIGGGWLNTASEHAATVGGGGENTASAEGAAVGGGMFNSAEAEGAAVGGGTGNHAIGDVATVPGGYGNLAGGSASFAAGARARAHHDYSFVWNDDAVDSLHTTGASQFRVRAKGGTWFFTNLSKTTGVYLAPGANSWTGIGSLVAEDFRPVDRRALLEKVAALRVQDYKLKDQADGTRHIGPVAQDFHNAFGYGGNETSINMADADGVALAAIQALYEDNRQLRQEVEVLKARLAGLK